MLNILKGFIWTQIVFSLRLFSCLNKTKPNWDRKLKEKLKNTSDTDSNKVIKQNVIIKLNECSDGGWIEVLQLCFFKVKSTYSPCFFFPLSQNIEMQKWCSVSVLKLNICPPAVKCLKQDDFTNAKPRHRHTSPHYSHFILLVLLLCCISEWNLVMFTAAFVWQL